MSCTLFYVVDCSKMVFLNVKSVINANCYSISPGRCRFVPENCGYNRKDYPAPILEILFTTSSF